MKKIFTLCRGKGCCPELFFDKELEKYILIDDYTGSIQLTANELIILKEKLNSMEIDK